MMEPKLQAVTKTFKSKKAVGCTGRPISHLTQSIQADLVLFMKDQRRIEKVGINFDW